MTTPRRRKLASVDVRVHWRGRTFESELEVTDSADWPIVAELLNQAYTETNQALIEYGEALTAEADSTMQRLADKLQPERAAVYQMWDPAAGKAVVGRTLHDAEAGESVELTFDHEPVGILREATSGDNEMMAEAGKQIRRGSTFTADLTASTIPAPGQSDPPQRGGQCRAIVVRQKQSGEVREPCGWTLFPDGSCNNAAAHLRPDPEPRVCKLQVVVSWHDDQGAHAKRVWCCYPLDVNGVCLSPYGHATNIGATLLPEFTLQGLLRKLAAKGINVRPENEQVPDDVDDLQVPAGMSLKERLAQAYWDRYACAPPEDMSIDGLRRALEKAR